MKQQIAIYLRLSLEDVDKRTNKLKDESNSIASQRLLINRHLDQNPLLCDLPRIEFYDDGFSGTNFDRPDFAKMIECAKHGEISCIVVKDLSRFGRDYLEVGDYLEHIFPFLGIRFISINDHYDSDDYKGTTGGLDVVMKNIVDGSQCFNILLQLHVGTLQFRDCILQFVGQVIHGLPQFLQFSAYMPVSLIPRLKIQFRHPAGYIRQRPYRFRNAA